VPEGEPGRGMNAAVLLWGLLFSSIGFGFFLYGRKQRAVVPLVCGIVLMVYPYFIPNVLALVAIGAVLTAVPYFLRL
jgi:membrane protein DedA with SNARE-associated domain